MIEKDLDPDTDDFYKSQPLPKDILKIYERIVEGKVDANT
jgi:internalin A